MKNGLSKIFALGLLLALGSGISWSQAIGYSKNALQVNCGILLLDSTSGYWGANVPPNSDPYVFFNLERRRDVKPPGWEFRNPLAPGTVTVEIKARWDAIYNFTQGTPSPFVLGDPISKNMAPYWEVQLSKISAEKLAQYDILLVHTPGLINLNPSEREKLRLFLDKGGILWFDKAINTTIDGWNGLPLSFTFDLGGGTPYVLQPQHPILSYPYFLSAAETLYLGLLDWNHTVRRLTLTELGMTGYEQVAATLAPDFDNFNIIVSNLDEIVIGVAQIGNGYFVVTSGDIASAINEPSGGVDIGLGPNSGAIAGDKFFNIPSAEMKFVFNMISLAGGHPALSKGSRRPNSTLDDLGAPLLQIWSDPNLNNDQGDHTNYVPPVIYKGLLFITSGNRLYAYKVDPSRDLDGDGWTDDGYQDSSLGQKFDLVWMSTALNAPLSTPMAVEVGNAQGAPKDQVYVVDGQGNLLGFDALPKSNGLLLGPNPIPPVRTIPPPSAPVMDFTLPNRPPYPPSYFEGLVYVVDTYQGVGNQRFGRVWIVDAVTMQPMTSTSPWVIAGSGSPNLFETGGAPTIGYIPINDGSGGQDKVLYVSNRSSTTGASVGITSIWLGAKGESPTLNRTATYVDVITRVSQKGLYVYLPLTESPHGVKIYLVDQNGNPLPPSQIANYLTGQVIQFAPGQLRVFLKTSLPNTIGVRIDYTVDIGGPSMNIVGGVIRGQLFFPDDTSRRRYVQKAMALAPSGNLFVVTSNEFNNGDLYCVREVTRGSFELVYRWSLYDEFKLVLNNTQTITIPSAIQDRDDLWVLMGMGYPKLRRLHFHSSPVVYGDTCYVMVSADQQFPLFTTRSSYILAFDANPTHRDIRFGSALPSGVKLKQPDIAASSFKSQPERFVTLQPNMADIQQETGVIRFKNMMSSTQGVMQNGFSVSLPVVVSGAGVPETLLDPNASGSKWTPLLWYFGVGGYMSDAPLMLMGNTLYLAGGSVLSDVFNNRFPPLPRPAMFAMDSVIPVNDESIITVPGYPGLKQSRWLIADNSAIGFHSNKHVRWPSGEGTQSFQDFVIRVEQTYLSKNVGSALGCIGGDGVLAAWADIGLYAFKRATTVVADEGRIVELDAAGFANWASDVSFEPKAQPTNVQVKTRKLERPTKVYKSGENEYVVVDTGGDRIVVLDKTAGEVRTIERILLDLTYRPPGWNEGDPLELRQPRDVSFWGEYVYGGIPFTGPPPNGVEYWVHYLIADTGNRRILELVDRYDVDDSTLQIVGLVRDAKGEPQIGVLYWHSPPDVTGKQWQHTATRRYVIQRDPNTNAINDIYITAIGDVMPTRSGLGLDPPSGNVQQETGGGPGGILIFIRNAQGQRVLDQVINEVILPDGTKKSLTGISSLFVRPVIQNSVATFSITFADRTGVYEIVQSGTNWLVRFMITNSVYESIRGVKLQAAAAKFLQNGDLLITNSYYGKTNTGANFFGEVTQWNVANYNPTLPNFGLSATDIKAELPPVVGTRGLRIPQYADRF
ncbi:MAG TPA: hypothetical protein VNK96_04420 [Fimbriimonadales bacterium]|nr:hypothetical protein [Fimbriimonadales bacterium]